MAIEAGARSGLLLLMKRQLNTFKIVHTAPKGPAWNYSYSILA
jgi:hypothetical protein